MMPAMVARSLEASTPTPGAPEKEAVRSMFDRIAPRYDLLNHTLSLGIDRWWRREAVSCLAPGGRVLDLCTGTADLLVACLEDPARGGVGVDLSRAMLALGARKLRARGLGARASLSAGDAERLPFRDQVFDGVLIAFGIRNVGDFGSALGEVRRVLRPGGRLVILECSMPPGLLGRAYRVYFEGVLPRLGGLVSGDPEAYAYLPASVGRFPEPARFREIMEASGFGGVRSRPLTLGTAQLYTGSRL
jgi:demethylmenaquinone methyltransferase/2-methoxy-6-polyprenyl-1,4-benzoquinol methylase